MGTPTLLSMLLKNFSATWHLFQQDFLRFSNIISISATFFFFQKHSSFFSNIFLTSATFSSFQQLRISATFSATWVYPRYGMLHDFLWYLLNQTLQKNTPLPLARQLSPLSRVPVQPVPRVVIVSLEFLVTGVIELFQVTKFQIFIGSL